MRTILFLSLTLLLTNCHNNKTTTETNKQQILPMAERIQIDGLKEALTKCKNGQTQFQFIGITSNGIDCIYFVYENGKFNLEFEAMTEKQIPFIDKLKEFANSNKFKNLMMTYNNKPKYKSDNPAPVLRIETNATIDDIVDLGSKIQSEIFHNNKKTTYEVVP